MKKYPDITTVRAVYETCVNGPQAGLPDGRWVPARPLPFYGDFRRWKAAWLVFTGRADALLWDGQ